MKKLISLLLVVCLLAACCTAFAATKTEMKQAADALNLLGLFRGTDKGYELENKLTREQGVTMLIRAMGNEQEALASADKCVFDDVYDWAKGYVGFAYDTGITKGISETEFGYGAELTDAMFLTMLLRALGYQDGEDADFTWEAPYELAKSINLIDYTEEDTDFQRGDMVIVIFNLLGCKFKGTEKTVADSLMEEKVFEQNDYANARSIRNGSAKLKDFQNQNQEQEQQTPDEQQPSNTIENLPGGIGGNPGSSAGGGSGSGGSTSETDQTHETPEVDPAIALLSVPG